MSALKVMKAMMRIWPPHTGQISGGVVKKKVKRVGITKQKVGAGCSEPVGETQPTLVETAVNRRGGNTPAFVSMNRKRSIDYASCGDAANLIGMSVGC